MQHPTQASHDLVKVLYIAGYGRSGSTLLDLLLGNAPRVEGAGELGALFELLADGHACWCGNLFLECPVWGPVLRRLQEEGPIDWQAARQLSLRGESLARIGQSQSGYFQLWSSLLHRLAEEADSDVIIDSSKTSWPTARRPLQLARSSGVEVSVIHLVRDPRAVLWSVRRGNNKVLAARGEAPRGSMLRGLLGWIIANVCAEFIRWRMPQENSIRIQYEQLVSQPSETLRRVGEFAKIDVEPIASMLATQESIPAGHGVLGNRMHRLRTISIKADREWENNLPAWGRVLAALVAPLAWRYGYTFSRPK